MNGWVSGRCLEGVWKVYANYLEGVWKVSGRCMEGIWKVSGRCKFCGTLHFSRHKFFLGPKICGPKFFFRTSIFLGPQIFQDPKFFGVHTDPKFFEDTNFLRLKIIQPKICFTQCFSGSKII